MYSKWPQTNVTNDQDICDDGERPKDFIKVIMTAFQKKPQAKKNAATIALAAKITTSILKRKIKSYTEL